MQLKLSTRVEKGVTVIDCNGRIVFGEESALLRDTVKKLVGESSRIILNLGGLPTSIAVGWERWWPFTPRRTMPAVR